jgi:O-acetyl-ADP-ribose deacetylase (regulator of RNase III)
VRGDITEVEADAFVFYARPDLALGSGFGTAISQRGGASILKELKEFGPIETGRVVVTGAGHLRAGYIVHAIGPRFNEADTEGKLRTTIVNSLEAADRKGVKRIAFPPMGTGFYGVPLELCSRVMVETIRSYLEGETGLEDVVLCVMDQREFAPFASRLALLTPKKNEMPA